jgi:CRP-like cAMP-binding protein
MDPRTLLASSPLFRDLKASATARLASALVPRHWPKDSAVYLRGDEATAFYGILGGRVRFGAASVEGREFVLDYAAAGQWFGEIGLFDGGPRVVDAFAAEPTDMVVLPRSELLAACSDDPSLPFRFLGLFSRRIRRAEDIIIDAAFLTLPARLARRLLALVEAGEDALAGREDAAVRLSQDELGRLTGVTRESAGKQLKAWEREGIVALEYGRVRVLDVAALRRIVAAAVGAA